MSALTWRTKTRGLVATWIVLAVASLSAVRADEDFSDSDTEDVDLTLSEEVGESGINVYLDKNFNQRLDAGELQYTILITVLPDEDGEGETPPPIACPITLRMVTPGSGPVCVGEPLTFEACLASCECLEYGALKIVASGAAIGEVEGETGEDDECLTLEIEEADYVGPGKILVVASSTIPGVNSVCLEVTAVEVGLEFNREGANGADIDDDDPGAYLCVTDDAPGALDDDDNRLHPLTLSLTPTPESGTLTLDLSPASGVKVWKDRKKTEPMPTSWELPSETPPSKLYLEAVDDGAVEATLTYVGGGGDPCEESVTVTNVRIEKVEYGFGSDPDNYLSPLPDYGDDGNFPHCAGTTWDGETEVTFRAETTPTVTDEVLEDLLSWKLNNDDAGEIDKTTGKITTFTYEGEFKSEELRDTRVDLLCDGMVSEDVTFTFYVSKSLSVVMGKESEAGETLSSADVNSPSVSWAPLWEYAIVESKVYDYDPSGTEGDLAKTLYDASTGKAVSEDDAGVESVTYTDLAGLLMRIDFKSTDKAGEYFFVPTGDGEDIDFETDDPHRYHVSVAEVAFVPDPDTHVEDSDALTVLPSDTEVVTASHDISGTPVIYTVGNDSIIRFVDELGALVTSITSTEDELELVVAGGVQGETEILAAVASDESIELGSIPVHVGGTITLSYTDFPTFSGTDGGLGEEPTGGPVIGGSAVGSGEADARSVISDDIKEKADEIELIECVVTVEVLDALGDVKPNKEIMAANHDGKLAVGSGYNLELGTHQLTDENGKGTVTLSVESGATLALGVDRAKVVFLVGELAILEADGNLILPPGTGLITEHENDLETLTYTRTVTESAAASFDVPLVNHHQFMVVKQALRGDVYESDTDWDELDYQKYGTGGSLADETGDLPDTEYIFLDADLLDDVIVPHVEASSRFANPALADTPTFTDHAVVSVAAISAELALSMAPGYDFVDAAKEFFWKPFFKEESPNYLVGVISIAGLMADAGYFTGVGAAIGVGVNYIAGGLKAIAKRIPEGLLKPFLKGFDSLFNGLKKIAELFGRIPDGGLAEKVSKLVTQWQRMLTSPLGVTTASVKEGVEVMSERAGRHYSDEAAEGIAHVAEASQRTVMEDIIVEFHDDVAEAAADVLRALDLDDDFSDAAVRGVAVCVDAVTVADREFVRLIADGTAFSGANVNRSKKFFENASSLKGVDGMDDHVRFVKENKNNLSGGNGVVFESTVAVKINSGDLSQIEGVAVGNVTRVSGDAITGAMKVDTITDTFAIQVKLIFNSLRVDFRPESRFYREIRTRRARWAKMCWQ